MLGFLQKLNHVYAVELVVIASIIVFVAYVMYRMGLIKVEK